MKFLSTIALSALALSAVADESELTWPMAVKNSEGKEVFTVDCHTKDGVPTVVIARSNAPPDEEVFGSMTAVSRNEDCQGEFARRTAANIGSMVAKDLLK